MNRLELVYQILLRMYLRAFRLEFEAEMQNVFAEALQQSGLSSTSDRLSFYLRELSDTVAVTGGALYWDGHAEPWMMQAPPRWYEAFATGLARLPLRLIVLFSPAIIGILRHFLRGMQTT